MGISNDNKSYTIDKKQTYDQISRELRQRGIDPDKVYEANRDKIRTHQTNKSDKRGWIVENDVLNIPADAFFKALGQPDQLSTESTKVKGANPAASYVDKLNQRIEYVEKQFPKELDGLDKQAALLGHSLGQIEASNESAETKERLSGEVKKNLADVHTKIAALKDRHAATIDSLKADVVRVKKVHEDWGSVDSLMSREAVTTVENLTKGLPDNEQIAMKAIAAELVQDGFSLNQPPPNGSGRSHMSNAQYQEHMKRVDSPHYHANFLVETLEYSTKAGTQPSAALKQKMDLMYLESKSVFDSKPEKRAELVEGYRAVYGADAEANMPQALRDSLTKSSQGQPATAATFDRSKVGVGTVLAPGVTSNPAMSGVGVMTTAAAATGVGLTKQSKQALQSEYTTEAVGDALLRNPEFQEALKNRGKTGQQYTEDMMNQLDAYLKSGKADLQSTGEPAPVSGESRFNDPEFKKQFYKAYMERFIELSNDENRTPGDPPKDVDIADVYITAITMTALEKAKNKKGGSDSDSSKKETTASAATGKETSWSAATGVSSQTKPNGVQTLQSAATAAPVGTNNGAFTSHATMFEDLRNGKNFPSADHGQFVAYMLDSMKTNINAMVPDSPAQREHIKQMQLTVANLAIAHAKDTATFAQNVSTAVKEQTDAYLVSAATGRPMPTVASNEPSARPVMETKQSAATVAEPQPTQAAKPATADVGTAAGPFENLKQIHDHILGKSDQNKFFAASEWLKGPFTDAVEAAPEERQLAVANELAKKYMSDHNIAAPTAKELRELKKKSS